MVKLLTEAELSNKRNNYWIAAVEDAYPAIADALSSLAALTERSVSVHIKAHPKIPIDVIVQVLTFLGYGTWVGKSHKEGFLQLDIRFSSKTIYV